MSETDHLQRISEQQVSELAAKYGRVKHVTYQGVDIVFRKPSRAECRQYVMARDNPQEKASADEALANMICVHCNGAAGGEAHKAFLDLLEDWPMAANSPKIGTALLELTGITESVEAKR